ncbi:MAG: type II-A CRISPR-associated protein Csn2 [Clostridiales bacterium]|nr:type II-A CRISPR-associated protein Csn2 [Clostridiales bacterium]
MFEELSNPLRIENDNITVLCVENKAILQKIANELMSNCENDYLIFSYRNNPIKYKNDCLTVFNYFSLEFPSAFIKKLYSGICNLINVEMPEMLSNLHSNILEVLQQINTLYDFELTYDCDFELASLLKMQSLTPDLSGESMIEKLIDYLSVISKYDAKKCYVLLLPSNYFSKYEIKELRNFACLKKLRIFILDITAEIYKNLSVPLTIIDNDLCEIVDTPQIL